jgi:hypothetical protein
MHSRRTARLSLLAVLGTAAALFLLVGCSTVRHAFMNAALGQNTGETEQAPAAAEPKAAKAPKGPSAASVMAAKYQFTAVHSMMWSIGWYGGKGGGYKPGQGTVWEFTGSKGSSRKPMTMERALLKENADTTQWWRIKWTADEDTFLYEFLVGADSLVQKVRYRDQETGAIGEFVPDQAAPQASAGTGAPTSREEAGKYVKGTGSIKVRAGTFTADHIVYTDKGGASQTESWGSDKVPGGLVKSIRTNLKTKETSTAELIRIDSGVTTELSSY